MARATSRTPWLLGTDAHVIDEEHAVDMKDRLKAWKAAHPELDESPEARAKRLAEERRQAALAEARARDERAKRAADERERALSDEELFRRAVGEVEDRSGAISKKYDAKEAPREGRDESRAEGKKLSDAQLFLDAVRDVPRAEERDEREVRGPRKR